MDILVSKVKPMNHKAKLSRVWWPKAVIPTLWKMRQENRCEPGLHSEFKASPSYKARLCPPKIK